jgi:hypothetical protein
MRGSLVSFVLFILLTGTASAQRMNFCDSTQKSSSYGSFIIWMDPSFRGVLVPVVNNDAELNLKGYRVQAYSGATREDAERVKRRLEQIYPKIPVYFFYDSPYFKVRIGDFRNRLDAQQILYELKGIFEGVLLVPDKINFPSLK